MLELKYIWAYVAPNCTVQTVENGEPERLETNSTFHSNFIRCLLKVSTF